MLRENEKLIVFDRLGVSPGGIGIKHVNVSQWGTQIEFECFYDFDTPRAFKLTFEHCLNISWTGEDASQEDGEVADVIGILLGESQSVNKATVTTDLFEISVMYRSMTIQWRD